MSNTSQQLKIKPNGMVLYPRDYSIDFDDSSKSYVRGVTQSGKEAVVFLHLSEQDVERAKSNESSTLPSLEDFSEPKVTASRRCAATDDNSPQKPAGILLVEQVKPLKAEEVGNFGEGVFVGAAKWMSILQQSGDHAPAVTGPGYLDVSFNFKMDNETKVKIGNYHRMHQQLLSGDTSVDKLSLEEQLNNLQREIINERKVFFSAVTLRPEEMIFTSLGSDLGEYANDRVQAFSEMIREPLERLTKNGQYGGVIVRIRRGDVVSSKLNDTINMIYDSKVGVAPFENVFQAFMKFGNKNLVRAIQRPPKGAENMVLEIIPCVRTNLGPRSYDRYKKDLLRLSESKILKTYVDSDKHRLVGIEDLAKQGAYVYSLMGVRTAETSRKHGSNLLTSAFHSYTAPIANALLINPDNYRYSLSKPEAVKAANEAPVS